MKKAIASLIAAALVSLVAFLAFAVWPHAAGLCDHYNTKGQVWLVTPYGKTDLGQFKGKHDVGPPAVWTNERGDTLTTRGLVIFQAHPNKKPAKEVSQL